MYDYEKEHLQALRADLAGCTVLLKKDGSFPLDQAGSIAAVGSGVRGTLKGGTGSGEVNSRFSVSIEQGLEEAGFTLTSKNWLSCYDLVREQARKDFYAMLQRRAKEHHTLALLESMGAVMPEPEYSIQLPLTGDVGIYVLSRICGEGSDRQTVKGDYCLTDTEVRDILAMNAAFERFMLVLNVGGPVDLSPVMEVKNILVLGQLGVETGSVLADILLGKAAPSGRLATSWSAYEDYCQIGNFGDRDDTDYREGIYVGYRYFDAAGKKPLFPFGFGLGYSEFQLSGAEVSLQGTRVCVKAKAENTGTYAGREVMQVYVSAPCGELDKPVKELAAFAKTAELQPGESQELQAEFDLCSCASYSKAQEAYLLEQGAYVISISNGQQLQSAAVICLDGTAVVRKAKNLLGECGFEDAVLNTANAVPEGLPQLNLSAADIACVETDYTCWHKEDTEGLELITDEDLVMMNIGGFEPHAGIASVIGDASASVAGAAGETPKVFSQLGLKTAVMADGPAGLRLAQHYYLDEEGGARCSGFSMPETMTDLLPPIALKVLKLGKKKPKADAEILDQYTTAIPIGTAIAQSWDLDFAARCGEVVGSEMERFGVHLWLAPALNIHRNVLCGRNFEYYSEDPVISGKFAAAITAAVQKHPACGTTIKHYAANNQETNRYCSSSNISERALREIYLKGFGICVREAQPAALMTSYNLLNGKHTNESRALTEILRAEFGFKGLVMTDWLVGGQDGKANKYHSPDAATIVAAGCSQLMPGGKGNVKDMLDGLKKGTVDREQLIENAAYTRALLTRIKNKELL